MSGAEDGDEPLLPERTAFNFSLAPGAQTVSARNLKTKTYLFLRGQYGVWSVVTVRLIVLLIVLNITSFIISTDSYIHDHISESTFDWVEGISVVIFTIEHLLRCWSCIVEQQYARKGPVYGRLYYMISFHALVDAFAILPWYASWFLDVQLSFTTALRVLRMFRMLKFDNYTKAFDVVKNVFYKEKELLLVASFYCFVALLMCASAMYMLEPNTKEFNTIPNAMFAMFMMFMGTFPESPMSIWGKLVLIVCALTGLTLIYVPTGIFASGFLEIINERKQAEAEARKLADAGMAVGNAAIEAESSVNADPPRDAGRAAAGDGSALRGAAQPSYGSFQQTAGLGAEPRVRTDPSVSGDMRCTHCGHVFTPPA